MLKKFCSKCEKEKDSIEFNKDPKGKLGLSGYCKACYKDYKKQKRQLAKLEKPPIEKPKIEKIPKPSKGLLCCYPKPYKKRIYKRHYSNTKCANCSNEKLSIGRFCLSCSIRISLSRWVTDKNEIAILVPLLIAKLEKSEYSCFYTGLPLVIGLNSSLDHRIPRSKGGTNDITNLEWVHIGINSLKSNRSEKEFFSVHAASLVELNALASKGVIL